MPLQPGLNSKLEYSPESLWASASLSRFSMKLSPKDGIAESEFQLPLAVLLSGSGLKTSSIRTLGLRSRTYSP